MESAGEAAWLRIMSTGSFATVADVLSRKKGPRQDDTIPEGQECGSNELTCPTSCLQGRRIEIRVIKRKMPTKNRHATLNINTWGLPERALYGSGACRNPNYRSCLGGRWQRGRLIVSKDWVFWLVSVSSEVEYFEVGRVWRVSGGVVGMVARCQRSLGTKGAKREMGRFLVVEPKNSKDLRKSCVG